MAQDNNARIAEEVLAAVGGKENVPFVTHCITRLRFKLADESKIDHDALGSIKGVLTSQKVGDQFQVVIGQNVGKVYEALLEIGGFDAQAPVDENLDADQGPLTPAKVGAAIMGYLSGSMVAIIPIMMAAAMMKTVAVVLGPDMLNLFAADSAIITLLNMVYNAGFYFLPFYLGYTAASKIGVTPVLGMMVGGLLMEPTFMQMAADGTPFSVFGIPCTPLNYAQTVLPILLAIWLMSYVEKFFKKVIPDMLSTVFTPFLTMAVMVPLTYCVCGPIGSLLGDFIGNFLFGLGGNGGIVAALVMGVIGASWEFLVMTGMHQVLIALGIANLAQSGVESFVFPASIAATVSCFGVALGAFLKLKEKDEKSINFGYFISGILGGVTEPTLFGLCFKHKRCFLGVIAGGFCGALYAGLAHVSIYILGAANFAMLFNYIPGGTANLVNGCISCAITFVVAVVVTYLFGFSAEELEADRKAAELAA